MSQHLEVKTDEASVLSNHILQQVIEGSRELIAALDRDYCFLAFNTAYQQEFEKVFGVRITLGASMVEALAHLPEEQAKAMAIWGRALKGDAYTTTEVFGDEARERKYYEIQYSCLYNETGQLIGASHIVHDISQKQQAEAEVARLNDDLEKRFSVTFESMAAGLGLRGRDGRWFKVNQRLCAITGYTEEELLGLTFLQMTYAEDLAMDLMMVERLYAGEIEEYRLEKRYIKKDGSLIWIKLVISAVKDEHNQFDYAIAVVEDISERKRVELLLKESESRFRTAFTHASVGFAMVDREGGLLYCNPAFCEITGYTEEALRQIDFAQITEEADIARNLALHQQLIRGEIQNFVIEKRYVRPDGTLIWVENSVSMVRGSSEGPETVLILTHSIEDRKKARQILLEEKERASLAVYGSNDGTWIWDIEPDTAIWNDRFLEIIGVGVPELDRGLAGFTRYIHPEDVEKVHAGMARHLASTDPNDIFDLEFRLIRPSGEIRYLFAKGRAMRDESGKPIRMGGVLTDITDRAKAELALKISEERLRRVVDCNMVGVMFARKDGVVTEANDAMLEMLGYTREDVEAGSVNWQTITPPSFYEADRLALQEMLDYNKCTPYEKQMLHKEGHPVDFLMVVAFLDETQTEGVAFCLDVTEKKMTERILKESEERFRTMADASPLMIWMLNESAKLEYYNKAMLEFTGQTIEEALNQGWVPLIHPDDVLATTVSLENAMKSRAYFEAEFRTRRADGKYRWLLSAGTPRFSPDGEYLGYVGSGIDIHDRKVMQIELEFATERAEFAQKLAESANQKKSQFLANMSHELRTPLNAVIGYSEMLQSGLAGGLNEKQSKYVDNIAISGRHLLMMVNDILDLAKVEAGKVQLYPELIDLPDLVDDLKVLMSQFAEKRHVHVAYSISQGLKNVFADPSRLKQILLNLLSNGVKFNRPGGEVNVRFYTQEANDYFVCEVMDTGIGMPPEKMTELFTEFYQVDASLSRLHEGTGLGLALSKRLVELHGGTISVESTEGIGSTFRFSFPKELPDTVEPAALY